MTCEKTKPEYYQVVDALVTMVIQFVETEGGLETCGVRSVQAAVDVLDDLGLIKNNRVSDDALDIATLKSKIISHE